MALRSSSLSVCRLIKGCREGMCGDVRSMCGNGGCKAGWRLTADGRCGSILRTGGWGEDGDGERGSRWSALLRDRRVGVWGGKEARDGRGCLVSIRGRLWKRAWMGSALRGESGGESVGEGSEGHTAWAVSVESQGLDGGCRGACEGDGRSTRMGSEGEGGDCEIGCLASSSVSDLRFLQFIV